MTGVQQGAKQECDNKPKQECKQVPRKDCKSVPKQCNTEYSPNTQRRSLSTFPISPASRFPKWRLRTRTRKNARLAIIGRAARSPDKTAATWGIQLAYKKIGKYLD